MTTAEYLAVLARKTRDLADDFLEAGYVEFPDFLRAIASIVDGDCPVHGREHPVVPIDGRDVDTPPEGREVAFHFWRQEGRPGRGEVCFCSIGKDHTEDSRAEYERRQQRRRHLAARANKDTT